MSDTDDENKRALIREVHEATKDALAAKRQLRDECDRMRKELQIAREMVGRDFNELAEHIVSDYMTALNGALAKHAGEINKMVGSADETIRRCTAELADMQDPDAFLTEIVSRLRCDITSALDSRFDEMAEELRQEDTGAKPHRRRQGQKQKLPPVTQLHLDHPIGIRLPIGGSRK
jgi:hypothetical protein